MSGQPQLLNLPAHRTGTTWEPFAARWTVDGVPADFSTSRARMVAKDGIGATVLDYDTAATAPTKPGLEFRESPDANHPGWWLYIVGDLEDDGTLVLPAGTLSYDLKIWFDDGTKAVDIYGSWQIIEGQTP